MIYYFPSSKWKLGERLSLAERNYKIFFFQRSTTEKHIYSNTDVMQQDADFITADFLYMFRASSAHHQEYKILTRQPLVQVVMVPSATITTGGCRVSILYS